MKLLVPGLTDEGVVARQAVLEYEAVSSTCNLSVSNVETTVSRSFRGRKRRLVTVVFHVGPTCARMNKLLQNETLVGVVPLTLSLAATMYALLSLNSAHAPAFTNIVQKVPY